MKRQDEIVSGAVLGVALCLFAGARVVSAAGCVGATGAARQDQPDRPSAERDANDRPAKRPSLTVRGLVLDAVTRRPIDRFRLIPGVRNELGTTWQPHLMTIHRHGMFELPPNERAWDETLFRVEAEGYRPGISRMVKRAEREVKLTFALEPDAGITAVVRTPAGGPAAGALGFWATLSHEATGHGATIQLSGHSEALGARVVTSDATGRLRLPPESDPGTIIVMHPTGYAEMKPEELRASGAVKLQSWCRVEGRVLAAGKPVVGQKVWVYRIGAPGEHLPTHSWEDEAITDVDGRFACNHVIAGRLFIDRVFSSGDVQGIVNGLAVSIEVREGRTTRVSLGGPGRTLSGRFQAPKDFRMPIDWSKVRFDLGLNAPHIGFPGDEPIWKIYRAFLNTEEGRAYYRNNLPVEPDGSFRVESVPPGDYELTVSIPGPAVARPSETKKVYAQGYASFQVDPAWDERSDERRSVGTINLRTSVRNP